ncbi:MAG: PEP-CTERM sorting domain-containing protein, partial [Akkermansiaceae bacterium]|nr:PEP-CTERM sorting domain-containing protein [Akkermansiaceae bacterium]
MRIQKNKLAAIAGLVLALGPVAQAATILYLGSDAVSSAAWRSTDVDKAINGPAGADPNGDNAYGNDGYSLVPMATPISPTTALPTYVTSVSFLGNLYNGGGGYPQIDDPTDAIDVAANQTPIITGITFGNSPITNFILLQDSKFVLTILLTGNSSSNRPTSLSLTRTVGGAATDAATIPTYTNDVHYLFFEVDGTAGDKFEITGGISGIQGIGGVAFEAMAIPEPSTFALTALGLLGLIGTRRRRNRA